MPATIHYPRCAITSKRSATPPAFARLSATTASMTRCAPSRGRPATSNRPRSKATTKLAEADSLVDWLRGGSKPASADMPKPRRPAPRARHMRRSKPATSARKFAWAATRAMAEEFGQTLMGRICRKQGQVRVRELPRSGLGAREGRRRPRRRRHHVVRRGRSAPGAKRSNAICLACHQKGERTYWAGSIARNARACLHQLPHDHEGRVAQASA